MFGRRKHRRQTKHTEPELPITPMLDMSFQLMSFFVFTFRPMPLEGQIALTLPSAGSETTIPSPLDPTEEKIKTIVKVYATSRGDLLSIEFIENEKQALKEPQQFGSDSSALFSKLQELMAGYKSRGEKIPDIEYQFAPELNYQFVIKLLDEATRAGYVKVSPSPMRAKKSGPAEAP